MEVVAMVALAAATGLCALAYKDLPAFKRLGSDLETLAHILMLLSLGGMGAAAAMAWEFDKKQILLGSFAIGSTGAGLSVLLTTLLWLRRDQSDD